MNLTFIDTETTWIEEKDWIIQLAIINDIWWREITKHQSYYSNWNQKISLRAKVVHWIIEDDLIWLDVFWPKSEGYKYILENNEKTIFVAHNAKFDIWMLKKYWLEISNYIDTLQVSKYLLQDIEEEFEYSYKEQVLKYWLIEKWIKFPIWAKAHDAMWDTLVLKVIFYYLLWLLKNNFGLIWDKEAIEKMIKISTSPIIIKKIPNGYKKYKWLTFEYLAQNDIGYIDWLCRNTSDENIKFTCKQYL